MKFKQIVNALLGDEYAKYYVLRKLRLLFGRHTDDFYWDIYTHHYRGEIADLAKDHAILLRPGDYSFDGGTLKRGPSAAKPLYANWHTLYETLLQLNPASVLEVGCGNGMHLHNLAVLAPGLRLHGLDRSPEQLNYLRELNPGLPADIRIADLTASLTPGDVPVADVCFSQAVIMHIKTGNNHLSALANMFALARNQVVLVENWKHHDFMGDIIGLRDQRRIPWRDVHFYYRRSHDTGKALLMLCSAVPLEYPQLNDYAVLRDAVEL